MKKFLVAACIALIAVTPVLAQDVREAVKKAEADRAAAEAHAREVEAKILSDRDALLAQVSELEARQKNARIRTSRRCRRSEPSRRTARQAAGEMVHQGSGFPRAPGNVRMAARDVEALIQASPVTALYAGTSRCHRAARRSGLLPRHRRHQRHDERLSTK